MAEVTIVGAGPAGLSTAKRLAERGVQVTVLEEDKEVGLPAHCSGLISKTGAFLNKLPIEGTILNEIQGAKLIAPNRESIVLDRFETVAYAIDRSLLDKHLAKEAEKAGAEIKCNSRLIDVRGESVFLQHDSRGEMAKSKIVVGADGVNSKVRELMGIRLPKEKFVNTYQTMAKGRFNRHFVELYFGDFAKGSFAWIIPHSKETALMGLGTLLPGNAKESFDSWIKKFEFDVHLGKGNAFLIPCGEPFKSLVKENKLLVGDAAFHTKATTGGGVVFGALAGNIAGDCIAEHLKKKKQLQEYDKGVQYLNKDLNLHWKIHKYFAAQSESDINKLFEKLKKANIETFLEKYGNMDQPSLFWGKVLQNPRLWGLAGEVLKIGMA
ncbi:MAG: geranylgeranyl reductase family protein [Candidatus Diapherotrites archaeon]